MPEEPEEKNRKLPERADALRVDLPFEEALRAAMEVPPPATPEKRKKRPKKSA